MKRRSLLKGIGLGMAAPILGPAVTRWVSEAHGMTDDRVGFVVLTDGNGWGHQRMGRNSVLLDTTIRSENDWDLPEVLSPFAPFREHVSIARAFNNFGGLHGSGWATLSGFRGRGQPEGPSIDRVVARELGREDAVSSLALGVQERSDRAPPCTSADGPLLPFPAFGSPLAAFQEVFGSGGSESVRQDRSLLDALVGDLARVRRDLARPEQYKLEQLETSFRSLEITLARREAILQNGSPPSPPSANLELNLNQETLEAHVDLIGQAFAFGLTRVAHLSILGFDDHNKGWGFLGFGGDAHENVAHVAGGYSRDQSTEAYQAIIRFKAGLLARLYEAMNQVEAGDSTLARHTLFLWINSGGGKHHHGSGFHPFVWIGDAHGRLKSGANLTMPHPTHVSEGLLSIAQALGLGMDSFGDPSTCRGPAPILA